MPIPAARALRNNVIDMTLDQDGLELVDGPEAPDVKPLVRRPAVRDEPGDREKLLQMWDLVQNPAYPPNVHRTAGEWVMRYYRARINTDAAIESIGDQLRVAAQFLKDEGHSRARLRQVVQAWFDLAMVSTQRFYSWPLSPQSSTELKHKHVVASVSSTPLLCLSSSNLP
jgi:hypothetical protein